MIELFCNLPSRYSYLIFFLSDRLQGYTRYSKKTWFYSHLTGLWINGPDLSQGRYAHSAGLIVDSVTKESFIVVSGGSPSTNSIITDSVEILNKEGVAWKSGKRF